MANESAAGNIFTKEKSSWKEIFLPKETLLDTKEDHLGKRFIKRKQAATFAKGRSSWQNNNLKKGGRK